MESDDEVKGDGNSYTTEYRQYDPRFGRWLSLDPMASKYTSMSPYNAFGNNPVIFVDADGDSLRLTGNLIQQKRALAQLQKLTNDELRIRNGKVLIKSHGTANKGKTLSTGTDLIEELIVHEHTATVKQNAYNENKATGELIEGMEMDRENRYNGTGKNAIVFVDFEHASYHLTQNKETGKSEEWYTPEHITLSHELIHALNILKGKSLKMDGNDAVYNWYEYVDESGKTIQKWESKEETDTVGLTGNDRYSENKIRKEQGYRKRVKY